MNTDHPNIAVLQKFNPENVAEAADILAKDAVWHYINPELPELEGDYIGLAGFKDFFKKMARLSNGSFKVNPVSITPFGDELVVTHVKDTMILQNQEMEIDAVVLWRIVNGKIKEAWDVPAVNTAKILNPEN